MSAKRLMAGFSCFAQELRTFLAYFTPASWREGKSDSRSICLFLMYQGTSKDLYVGAVWFKEAGCSAPFVLHPSCKAVCLY